MSTQVYPQQFDASFVDALDGHPRILVIRHPFSHKFQVYEVPKGSSWDAQRLFNAIVVERENIESEGWPEHTWWTWDAAPYILDETDRVPGQWLIRYLDERDWRRSNVSIEDWERELDKVSGDRRAAQKKAVHDVHVQMARDEFHRLRDISRGDEPRPRAIMNKETL